MKISVEWVVDSILLTFFIIIVFGILNITSNIKQAYNYHHYMIAQIEASNFNQNVITQLENNSPYIHEIEDCSILTEDELYVQESIFKIKTTYNLELPIIGYKTTQSIIGYAR